MRILNSLSLGAVGFLGVSCFSLAQPPGGGGFGGMMQPGRGIDPSQLLLNKSIQEELKLSDDSAKEILLKYTEESSALLSRILAEKGNKEQAKRLEQIRTQLMGLRAFTDDRISIMLKLTADQKKEIKELAEDVRKESDELRQGIGMDFSKMGEMMKQVAEMNKQALSKASEILKDDQKKTWTELVGKPFEIKMVGGGRGGPGRPKRVD